MTKSTQSVSTFILLLLSENVPFRTGASFKEGEDFLLHLYQNHPDIDYIKYGLNIKGFIKLCRLSQESIKEAVSLIPPLPENLSQETDILVEKLNKQTKLLTQGDCNSEDYINNTHLYLKDWFTNIDIGSSLVNISPLNKQLALERLPLSEFCLEDLLSTEEILLNSVDALRPHTNTQHSTFH